MAPCRCTEPWNRVRFRNHHRTYTNPYLIPTVGTPHLIPSPISKLLIIAHTIEKSKNIRSRTVEFSIPLRQCTGISLQRFEFKFRMMFSLSSRLKRGLIVNRLHCRTQSTLYAKIDEKVIMFFPSLDSRPARPRRLLCFCASVSGAPSSP